MNATRIVTGSGNTQYLSDFTKLSIEQHHHHARHSFQMIMVWYTFFVSANVLTGGWFVTDLLKWDAVPANFVFGTGVVFIIANICGIVAMRHVRKTFQWHSDYANGLASFFLQEQGIQHPLKYVAIPVSWYKLVTRLFSVTFYCMIGLWIAGVGLAYSLADKLLYLGI